MQVLFFEVLLGDRLVLLDPIRDGSVLLAAMGVLDEDSSAPLWPLDDIPSRGSRCSTGSA